jgi:hypothetical protein
MTAPLSGQGHTPRRPPHSAAVIRPFSLGAESTPVLQAVADTTRAHLVDRLKAAGVLIVDRSRTPVKAKDLSNFVAAHFAVVGVVGIADSQFVVVARLVTMPDGDSLSQVRLAGSLATAAVFGDSLGTLFAPTILGRPLLDARTAADSR